METFSALLVICAGNSPVPGEFPTQMPVTRSFDVFFDLYPNKRLSKQWWGWWFETPSRPLRRHRNEDGGQTTILSSITWKEKIYHDDVIKWKHFPPYWPFVRRIHLAPVIFPHKGQWRGALMSSLICTWINDRVSNGEAGVCWPIMTSL